MAKRKAKKGPKPRAKVSEHEEAIRWFKSRVPIRKEEWLELSQAARKRAFTVARVANLNVINDTLKAITKAIENGETLEQFRDRIGGKLEKAWGSERAWHVDVIFRNNVQAAYAYGREQEMRTPAALELRPYWLFSAILDDRTTEICRPLNGKVVAAESRWWETHTPPLHHNCRSIKRALTPAQAEKRGISTRAPKVDPMEGFGHADPLEYEPDLAGMPPNLVKKYKQKRR